LPYAILQAEGPTARLNPEYNFVNNAVVPATNAGTVMGLTFQRGSNPFTDPASNFMPQFETYESLPAGLLNRQFSDDGQSLVDWQTGRFIDNDARLMAGGEGVAPDEGILMRVPVERQVLYGRFQYDLTSSITGFVEASYGNLEASNSQGTVSNSLLGVRAALLIKADNAYLPTEVRDAILNAGATGIRVNKPLSAFPEDAQAFSTSENETQRVVTGLEGSFNDGWLGERSWEWDSYYSYGVNEREQQMGNLFRRTERTALNYTGLDADGIQYGFSDGPYADGSYPAVIGDPLGIYGVSNLNLALDAVVDPVDNVIKCRINSSLRLPEQDAILSSAAGIDAGIPELVAGCQPLNLLGVGNYDSAALAWTLGTQTESYEYTQHIIGGNAQGELFDIWTGPVLVAGGFEYRDEQGETLHNAPAEYWNPDYGSEFAGGQEILEVYLETDFSLLRDLPMVRDLAVNRRAADRGGGYRQHCDLRYVGRKPRVRVHHLEGERRLGSQRAAALPRDPLAGHPCAELPRPLLPRAADPELYARHHQPVARGGSQHRALAG
jgi:hypothetical protein